MGLKGTWECGCEGFKGHLGVGWGREGCKGCRGGGGGEVE